MGEWCHCLSSVSQYLSLYSSTSHTASTITDLGENWITLDEKSPPPLPPEMKLRIPPFTCIYRCRVTHGDQIGLAFTPDSCLQAVVIVEYNILAWMCGSLPKSCQSVVAKVCRSYEWHITAAHDLSGDVCPKGRPALTQPFTAEDNEQASAMFEGPACPRQAEHRRNDNYTHSSPHCIVDHLFVKHWSVV